MKCPYCLAYSMESELVSDSTPDMTVIDLCPNCHGLWFDKGEMSDFLKWFECSGKGFGIKELLVTKPKVTSEPAGKMCPHCSVPLKVFNYAYNSNIFLDKCPECSGVWVDNGEINNIAKYQKGHPLLDAYAGDLAEHSERVGASRDVSKRPGFLMRRVGYGPFRFPLLTLPLSDLEKITIVPSVTLGIILINIAVFIISLFISDVKSIYQTYGLCPNINPMTFITSMFIHLNWIHLVGNMLFFYVFADKMENVLGHWRFLAFYLFVGVAAGLIDVTLWGQTHITRIGASGAISGIMGGYFLMFPKSYIKVLIIDRVVPVYAQFYMAIWIAGQIFMATMDSATYPFTHGVAWFAHIGGFFSGMAAIYALRKYKLLPKEDEH